MPITLRTLSVLIASPSARSYNKRVCGPPFVLTQIATVTSFHSPTFATSHTRWTLSEIWAFERKRNGFFSEESWRHPSKKVALRCFRWVDVEGMLSNNPKSEEEGGLIVISQLN
ncbi:MAG: hypothetical protein U9O90_04865 [Euryarchaeota archaeon]|nr:hypothetical protein [Euryarchaeota archaeon]